MSDELTAALERLLELEAKATSGPWRDEGNGICNLTDAGKGYPLDYYTDSVDVLELDCPDNCRGCPGWSSQEDAELAVAARNALRPLVEAYLAALEELRLSRIDDGFDHVDGATAHATEEAAAALLAALKGEA